MRSTNVSFFFFLFFSFFILAVVDVPVNDIRPIYPASIYSRPMDVSVQNTFVHCPINRFFLVLFAVRHQRQTHSFISDDEVACCFRFRFGALVADCRLQMDFRGR